MSLMFVGEKKNHFLHLNSFFDREASWGVWEKMCQKLTTRWQLFHILWASQGDNFEFSDFSMIYFLISNRTTSGRLLFHDDFEDILLLQIIQLKESLKIIQEIVRGLAKSSMFCSVAVACRAQQSQPIVANFFTTSLWMKHSCRLPLPALHRAEAWLTLDDFVKNVEINFHTLSTRWAEDN